MIITRTPFRISFAGGGSDLWDFYSKYSGCTLSTTINKYMYLSVHPCFLKDTIVLKYSKTETVTSPEQIEHRIFRQVLKDLKLKGVEITSIADVPSGTGLGSSSAFTVGLLHTLYYYLKRDVSKEQLASEACRIEIEKLMEPIGKQDQYASSYGGFNFITFHSDEKVSVEKVAVKSNTIKNLEENLLLFYTGEVRSASKVLKEQKNNLHDSKKIKNIIRMTELAKQLKKSLEENNTLMFGEILNEGWQLKKTLANGITNELIDGYYDIALKNGAIGGKVLGAGGGGFLLFYSERENHEKLRRSLMNLEELKFNFDCEGSKLIYMENKY